MRVAYTWVNLSGGMVAAEPLRAETPLMGSSRLEAFFNDQSAIRYLPLLKVGGQRMLTVDGELIKDGMDMISYLDRKLQEIAASNKVATGIVIGSHARKALTEACQKVMGQVIKPMETVNRFRNILIIEDGDHPDRLELICGIGVVSPVEGNAFLDLKKVGPGVQR